MKRDRGPRHPGTLQEVLALSLPVPRSGIDPYVSGGGVRITIPIG